MIEPKRQKEIYVIGHKNPDTDSICSAIAYASLKNEILARIQKGESVEQYHDFLVSEGNHDEMIYVPVRAGQVNTETEYVLNTFGQSVPVFMNAIRTQVCDINIRRIAPISSDFSLKKAWETMRKLDTSTLAVTDEQGLLEGLITMSDITGAYMSMLNNEILSEACTPISNILDTLNGTLVVGESDKILTKGKLVVSTATLNVIGDFVHEDDLVILGNRYEAQLSAIENKASCIIICDGAKASRTICKLAEENGCAVICTPYDTFTVTRNINQSIPVDYFMIKEGLVAFNQNDYVSDIKPTMMRLRHRDFLIIDDNYHYVGMISRRALIGMDAKKVILVDHNEMEQAAEGVDEAEVVEIIDHHKLGTVETIRPVKVRNEPVGCTATIIYEMYQENQIPLTKSIAGILCSAIVSDTLMFRSPTCTAVDQMAAEQLAEIAGVDLESHALKMFEEGSQLSKKTEFEIFYQDYKKFNAGDNCFGVGQITSVNLNELMNVQERLLEYMKSAMQDTNTSMVFFMLTDILKESTRLLFVGKEAKQVVENAFRQNAEEHYIDLEGMVSRKKQLIPKLLEGIQ
ncbi:MAG: putative manganese-dependent inorganic diphosphatase [Lachnospiraceae bacterium]|nr:putative manganese-dependent inorganic diphosphatase [Lachnospiraceae bacterium]